MSTAFLPPAQWASGTNQNSIPANDNALRFQISQSNVNNATTAQPALTSPADDGKCYIIQSTHTGAQWAGFTPKDVAVFYGGTWYAYAPVEGLKVSVGSAIYMYTGGAWASTGGGGMTNPMTTTGDIIYSSSGTTPARLGVGTNGWVLTLAAGVPTWAAATGGFSNPMTTAGDVIYGGASGVATRLAAGTSTYVLTSNGAGVAPSWQAAASGFANPMTTAGDVIYGGASGVATRLAAGTSTYVLTSNGAGVAPSWQAAGGGGLTGFTGSLATASPNNTINSSLLIASGGTADQDFVISAKGTGAVIVGPVPDSGTGGGNKRGANATDLQFGRTNAARVASGTRSFCAGYNNLATGTFAACLGSSNSASGAGTGAAAVGVSCNASGQDSVAVGYSSTASGGRSLAIGSNSLADGDRSTAQGYNSTTRGLYGALSYASGVFSSQGDAQTVRFVHRTTTTNATPTALSADASAPTAATAIVLPNNSAYAFEAIVVGKVATFGDRASFKVTGMVSRGANAAATVIDGTVTVTALAQVGGASAWAVTATANTTLGSLSINATGVAATTIKWVASIQTTELVG
jgi:hypothetical protein